MSIATIGAFIVGEYPEGVAVMLFYQMCIRDRGKISAGIDEGLDRNQVLFFAPYGIASFPPKGEDLLLLQDAGKLSCMGVRSTQNGLEEGELELFSSGGASILLQNDGSVVINGAITITDEGLSLIHI